MNNESQANRPIAVGALCLSLLAFCAGMISLLTTDPGAIRDRIVTITQFLLGQNASQFVTDLPIVRLYAELWPMYLVFVVFLVAITYYEFKQHFIPDAVTMPGTVIGIGFVAGFHYISLLDALLGLVVGVSGLWALNIYSLRAHGREGMGAGVVKMQGMLGAFLGLENSIAALVLASILATIYAAAFRRRSFSENLEFGPWLAIAALLFAIVPVSELLRQRAG